LMRRTAGIMRLISRWFFEPTIFLMMKLIMPGTPCGREKFQNIRPGAAGKGNWHRRLARTPGRHNCCSMKPLLPAALASIAAFQSVTAQTPSETPDPDAKKAVAAISALVKSFQDGSQNPLAALGAKPAVDFRQLKALLPEELAGLRRTNARGEKTGAFGANVSSATGEYGAPGGPRMVVKITDVGATGPFGALAGLGWLATEVDSEGDEGYERTTLYGKHKGLEKYRNDTKAGSVDVVVAGRFLINIEGTGIEAIKLQTAAASLELDTLEQMAGEAADE